jgi:hypothetical protein
MLELKLDDNFRIITDNHNFILEKYENTMDIKTKELTGNYKWKTCGYYSNKLEYALKAYVIESMRDEGKSEVHNLLDRLNELEKVIKRQVKKENIKLINKSSKEDE